MMKKVILTASVASMLDNFNRGNIKLLQELGYDVTLAANFDASEDSSPPSRIRAFRKEIEAQGCRTVHIDFSRKVTNLSKQLKSYRQLKALARENFALVHCNSPICAAMTRLAFRKQRKTQGTRVIYTAHGFHFFRGAPVRNWLLYFPVEWVCAWWTDILNTVNEEDYRLAKRWFKARRIVWLPSAGIDLKKFKPGSADREAVRVRLGLSEDEKVMLSVGELSRRKNQENVIRAMALIIDKRGRDPATQNRSAGLPGSGSGSKQFTTLSCLRYVIVGRGEKEAEMKALAAELGLSDYILFLGYREDVVALCQAADLFVFPSLQEGMPMALMEAIAVNAPVICSDIRGNRELVRENELRFDPKNPKDIAGCINRALREYPQKSRERHLADIEGYRIEQVEEQMRKEYALSISL